MKTLNFDQMERVEGGISLDCSSSSEASFIAGAGIAGAFGGPFGFLGGLLAAEIIVIAVCHT